MKIISLDRKKETGGPETIVFIKLISLGLMPQ